MTNEIKDIVTLLDPTKIFSGISGKISTFKIGLEVIFICFQKYPGIEDDALMKDGPEAEFLMPDVKDPIKVKPVNAIYTVILPTKYRGTLKISNTSFFVQHRDKDDLELSTDSTQSINNWQTMHAVNKRLGQLQRLQMIGYYNAPVYKLLSGSNRFKYERSILNFQADNKLRTDGIAGPKTSSKLDNIINSKNKSGDNYIIRKALIRFTRAPTEDPKMWSGRPWAKAPDPDDRGFTEFDTIGKSLKGPVVTMTRNTEFRIKIIRENISSDAQLMVLSNNKNVVEVVSPSLVPSPYGAKALLPKQKEAIIKLKAVNPGDGKIEINYVKDADQINIGSLKVIVLSLITRLIRPHWVTIADAAGNHPTAPPDTKGDWEKVFDITNNIWWPYGIYFKVLPWREKTVNLSTAGRISQGANLKNEFNTVINTNDSTGNASETNVINLLIVNGIENCVGVAYDALDYTWPNGIALTMNPAGKVAAGNDLAHELGHYLSLANCLDPGKYIHSDDDPDSSHKKKDIWTIRKLMYSYNPHAINRNVGYGSGRRGCMVTVRNLADKTDNECSNARKWARNPNFYKKP